MSSSKADAATAGVESAWDFWLSQHEVTVSDCIMEAVETAVGNWLDEHTDELIVAIAETQEENWK